MSRKIENPTGKTLLIRQFRESHPSYDKEWRDKNIEKVRESGLKYRSTHIEQERVRSKMKRKRAMENNPEHEREKGRVLSKTPRGRWNNYKKGARTRQIFFDLSFELFAATISQPCIYCGDESNGIDRVNNDLPYIENNIAPCCRKCNHMKRNWTRGEFIDHCRKVTENSHE